MKQEDVFNTEQFSHYIPYHLPTLAIQILPLELGNGFTAWPLVLSAITAYDW